MKRTPRIRYTNQGVRDLDAGHNGRRRPDPETCEHDWTEVRGVDEVDYLECRRCGVRTLASRAPGRAHGGAR
jgi:hypothetical protein